MIQNFYYQASGLRNLFSVLKVMIMKKYLYSSFLLLFSLCLGVDMQAQTTEWEGNNSTDWFDPGNWDNGVPTATAIVNIPSAANNPEIDGNATATAQEVNLDFAGQLTIKSGSQLDLQEITIDDGELIIESSATLNSTSSSSDGITLSDPDASLTNNGTINVSNSNIDGIYLDNGSASFTNNGTITITSAGVDGISMYDNAASFTNDGMITINGADFDGIFLETGSTFTNNGSIAISNTSDDGIDSNTSGTLQNNGTVDFSNMGDNAIDDIAFNNNSGGAITGSGHIEADGFAENGGTIAPDGTFLFFSNMGSFTEDFTQTTFEIDINGLADFDQIVLQVQGVMGTAQADLGSTLNVTFNFMPSAGDRFAVFSADNINGNFTTINSMPNHTLSFDNSTGEIVVNALVPVELISFTAKPEQQYIRLHWKTATELNNAGFEVQRLVDSGQSIIDGKWKVLTFVKGHGTTVEPQNYSYLDKDLTGFGNLSGLTLYYRLRQVDYDGAFEYSEVIAVNAKSTIDNKQLHLFPNPVVDILNYQVADLESVQRVQLFDVNGKLLRETTVIDGQLSLNGLPKGVYLLVLETASGQLQQRVVKE